MINRQEVDALEDVLGRAIPEVEFVDIIREMSRDNCTLREMFVALLQRALDFLQYGN